MGREHTRSSPWVHRGHPAFPHTMVLTVSFVISPVIGLVCHRRLARLSARLDASVEASEPHDFAVRVQHRSSAVPSTSIASRPASVTIASALWWDETARLSRCFASERNEIIFRFGTGQLFCPSGTSERLTAAIPTISASSRRKLRGHQHLTRDTPTRLALGQPPESELRSS